VIGGGVTGAGVTGDDDSRGSGQPVSANRASTLKTRRDSIRTGVRNVANRYFFTNPTTVMTIPTTLSSAIIPAGMNLCVARKAGTNL